MNLSSPRMLTLKNNKEEFMNMFNLVARFWRMAEDSGSTTSEAALYFYLLNRANTQMWRMPIRCPTAIVCVYLNTSKQNVMKAREGLRRKGLITFTPGSGINDNPLYTLTESNEQLFGQMSGELSDKLPSQFSGQLSESLSPLKDKEKDKESSITNARMKTVLGLDDLERMFLADQEWIESVFRLLLSKGMTDASIEMVKEKVSMFFQYLRATGQSEREKNDCKNHFVNWLVKQPLNNKFSNANNKQGHHDKRRAVEATPAKSSDYEGSF